jgi:adenosyl cobinamide kinase/adenosyl cobinamide phosphate guanylyltransferase
MLTLLIGGARSGKSTLAVQMAERHGAPVTFLATAEPCDDDLRDRIERHRAERPPHWTTVECPVELADAVGVAPVEHFVVIDCLTVWFGNLFAHHVERDAARDALVDALRQRAGHVVVVTNEVGMGIHPDTSMGREYRDELGRLNQMVAAIADTTLLLVAGRAMRLHDPLELL